MSDPHFRPIELDLRDHDGVVGLLERERPEVVVHLAWYAGPRDYLSSHENLESLAATLRLGEASFRAGVRRFVGAGTCVEYAAGGERRRDDGSSRVEPDSLYAATKHGAHVALRALAREARARLAWARIFHLHGPGEDPARLVPTVAATLRAGRVMELTAGEQVRDHLHVSDAGEAIAMLAHALSLDGPVNVCSGEPVTLREVLETVGELVGRKDLLKFGARPYRDGETMYLCGDASRLKALGFTPRFPSLREGLRDALGR